MHTLRLIAIGALLSTALACGGDNGTSPSRVQQPYNETITGTVSSFGSTRHALTTARSGNMTVRLAWTDPVVDLDLYLAPVGCTSLYPKASCGILASSDAATGTQESIARTVSSGETFQLWVDNLNITRPQNYTLTLTIN